MQDTMIMSMAANNANFASLTQTTEALTNGEMVENASDMLSKVIGNKPVTQIYDPVTRQLKRSHKKIGRNDLCPCGSGKKYKHCCLKTAEYEGYEEV